MSFSTDIVALKTKYSDDLVWPCVYAMNLVLAQTYSIRIKREVTFDNYLRESSSKPMNRYLRMPVDIFKKLVPGANLKEEEKRKGAVDIAYDRGRTESPKFANSRHFVVSVSAYGDYTLLWFNFHPQLVGYLPGFHNVYNSFARALSVKYNTESVYMHTTSMSRTDASFVIYSAGSLRGNDTGKDSLTVLKNDYSIDVNMCMDNVDNNIAIYYAPFDLANITKQIYDQENRYKAFMEKAPELVITDKESGENMVKKFTDDNNTIMKELQNRKARTMEAMTVEGFGTLVFLELDREPIKVRQDLQKETFFGRVK